MDAAYDEMCPKTSSAPPSQTNGGVVRFVGSTSTNIPTVTSLGGTPPPAPSAPAPSAAKTAAPRSISGVIQEAKKKQETATVNGAVAIVPSLFSESSSSGVGELIVRINNSQKRDSKGNLKQKFDTSGVDVVMNNGSPTLEFSVGPFKPKVLLSSSDGTMYLMAKGEQNPIPAELTKEAVGYLTAKLTGQSLPSTSEPFMTWLTNNRGRGFGATSVVTAPVRGLGKVFRRK
jgi:hypothetical protein